MAAGTFERSDEKRGCAGRYLAHGFTCDIAAASWYKWRIDARW